ncbi:hypothetical protein BDZ89DRAFT_1159403 [Hymenopellis radicata]|nr:hypothetical protein BDZ89DRAFT_1159403 [Hymenopellis radicata]
MQRSKDRGRCRLIKRSATAASKSPYRVDDEKRSLLRNPMASKRDEKRILGRKPSSEDSRRHTGGKKHPASAQFITNDGFGKLRLADAHLKDKFKFFIDPEMTDVPARMLTAPEMVDELDVMVRERLLLFKEKNRVYPKRTLLVYRDGVSEVCAHSRMCWCWCSFPWFNHFHFALTV